MTVVASNKRCGIVAGNSGDRAVCRVARETNAYIVNAFQASKMPAHSCAGETRIDQRFPSVLATSQWANGAKRIKLFGGVAEQSDSTQFSLYQANLDFAPYCYKLYIGWEFLGFLPLPP